MTCFRVKFFFTGICLEDLSKIKINGLVSWPEFELRTSRICIRSIVLVGYFKEMHKMEQ
jgi:hypothetical protein